MRIYTIGHSNRSFENFLNILKFYKIEALIDVRRFPTSKFEHFKAEFLQAELPKHGIDYIHLEKLGGFRKEGLKDSPNTAIKSIGFRNYADYMLSGEFELEIEKVIQIASKKISAIMCSERVFWRCHRKFISDYLTLKGFEVVHILDDRILIHGISKNARVERGKLVYDRIDS